MSKEALKDHFKELEEEGIFLICESDKLLEVSTYIKEKLNFPMLLEVSVIDYLHQNKPVRFAIIYHFRNAAFNEVLSLKSYLKSEKNSVPSLTSLYESANWLERESYDQYGITFSDHPMLKRVLNHMEFEGHPLRKDYEVTNGQFCFETQDMMDEIMPLIEAKKLDIEKDSLMVLNMGPSHPASHGTIRTVVVLDGERIVTAAGEIGYLHRGFEKSCEHHTYNQIIPYTDRLNYCSALMNNVAFAKTVEEMLGLSLPDRAVVIRVMLCELSRIIDHLVCLAAAMNDIGAQTNYWYLFNPRNIAYDFLSKLTGARLTNSFMRIGGMTHDLYDGWQSDLEATLRAVEEGVEQTLRMVEHNRIFIDRTQNISSFSAEEALSYAFSGPCLRASGVKCDMRLNQSYYDYSSYDFNMVVGSVGDNYDRYMVRFGEIKESIKIVRQAIKRMPEGSVCVENHDVVLPEKDAVYNSIEGAMNQFKLVFEGVKVPSQEYYSAIEAANGELGFSIVSDGSGTPYKVKVRAPSFVHMSALPKLIENEQVGDSVLTLGSLNLIAGEMDR